MPLSDADRLAALERAVLDLRRDVHDLRTALNATRPAAAESGAREPSAAAPTTPPVDRIIRLPPEPRSGLRDRAAAYARAQAAGLGVGPGSDGTTPDFEAVVGRYGTVAVAALLILMAVGAFLTWAVANFDLSSAARVALGAVAAAALAALGTWLRTRPNPATRANTPDDRDGTRHFGDALLALALAVTHVEAWAAGPYLGLVPPAAALAVAAVASLALAALAWRAGQQSLFLVGVGGALVAPFVTGSAAAHPTALRLYGWVVLSSALLAIPTAPELAPRWRSAFRLLALGGATYTAAYFGGPLAMAVLGNPAEVPLPGWMLQRHLPVVFALACALVPLGRTARASLNPASTVQHARLTLAYLSAATVALLTLAVNGSGGTWWVVALALATTLLVYATVGRFAPTESTDGQQTAGARLTPATVSVIYPLLLLAAALAGLPQMLGTRGAITAASWGALAAVAAWRTLGSAPIHGVVSVPAAPPPTLPSAHAAAAGLATALVPVLLLSTHDVARVTLLALHAGLTIQLLRHLRHPLTLLSPAVVGCVAAAWAWVLLDTRRAYAYMPFLTQESVGAGAVVFAWAVIAHRVWRDGSAVFPRGERRFVVGLAVAVALGWGREELAHAIAPDISTVLLIAYFATTGISAIAFGRARQAPAARQMGLVLALYAAAKALLQASQLDAVGLRVVSYLVVGGFLLGVGYWYRAAGASKTLPRQSGATPAI